MSIVAKYPNNTESDPLALKQANNLSDLNNVATAKSNLSLNNVDNTSDIDKPVSSATQSALNDKQDTLVSGTNIKSVNGESLVGAGDLLLDYAPAISRTTQTNLTCDFASTNYIIATTTGNQSFSLSNVPIDEIVTVLIINTGGGDITLPNTADKYSNATWTHTAGGIREYSLLYDGTTRYWQVSEELL